MGVLKVRSGGAWVNVGVGGGPLPPGGVLGDILVKQSATLSDALWGFTLPKLRIGPNVELFDPSVAHMLGLRSTADSNSGYLRLGSLAEIRGTSTYIHMRAPTGGDAFMDGNTDYFRTAAGQIYGQWTPTELLVATAYGRVRLNAANGPYIGTTDGATLHLHGITNAYLDGDRLFIRTAALAGMGSWGTDGISLDAAGQWLRTWGTNGIYFTTYGVGVHAQEANYIHAYLGSGSGAGFKANGTGAVHAGYFEKWDYYSASCNWPNTQVRVCNDNGGLAGSSYAAIAFNPASAGVAPLLGVLGNGGGERLAVLNSSGAGFAPIAASAFPVASSLRYKERVRELGDEETIAKVRCVRGIHFHDRTPPLNVRYEQRFIDINERWQKHGHRPLVAKTHHVLPSAAHDCDVDPCDGSRLHPCNVAMSFASGRYGLAAEAIYDILPEMVELDTDRQPQMLNVDQVAALALAAVAALSRRVEQLEQQLREKAIVV